MRGHDKTILVAHKNHSRTPLSYEDVVQQHHSFRSTAVVQFGRSSFFFFFFSSGGWVKIELKLPHFHVSDSCRVSI